MTAKIRNVPVVVPHPKILPYARLQRELQMPRFAERDRRLQVSRVNAPFRRAATAVRFMLRAALQIDPDNRHARKELSMQPAKKGPEGPIWKKDLGSFAKKIFKK